MQITMQEVTETESKKGQKKKKRADILDFLYGETHRRCLPCLRVSSPRHERLTLQVDQLPHWYIVPRYCTNAHF